MLLVISNLEKIDPTKKPAHQSSSRTGARAQIWPHHSYFLPIMGKGGCGPTAESELRQSPVLGIPPYQRQSFLLLLMETKGLLGTCDGQAKPPSPHCRRTPRWQDVSALWKLLALSRVHGASYSIPGLQVMSPRCTGAVSPSWLSHLNAA